MELFRVGPFVLRLYTVMVLSGLLAGTWLATREARRRGENPSHAVDVLVYCIPLALIGARIYHVVSSWGYYQLHPHLIPAIWKGGLGIYGAVVGAILGLAIYTRWNKLSLPRWMDIAAPGLLLGQAIGRWGNFFNQELYGPPTETPWGIYVSPEHRLAGYEAFERFHPLFLYEILWSLVGVAILLYAARALRLRLRDGDIALAYGIIYPLGRFMLEPLRLDSWTIIGFPAAQWVSLTAMLACGVLLLWRHPPRLSWLGLAWLVFLTGVAVLAVVALKVVTLSLLPVVVLLISIYGLAGLVAIARLTTSEEVATGRRRTGK